MISILKHVLAYRLGTSPELETAIICIALLFLLFFGAFVKLKNGILSWLSYILLVSIPIVLLTINIININLPVEDLKLSDVKVEQYSAVTGEGLEFKRLFRRTVNEPLLGIQPATDPQRIDDFTAFIQRTYPDNNVAYRTSKKYDGIMLVDAAGNDLNLSLIKDGYFNISVKAPSQYLVAANDARSRGVGIWANTVGMQPSQIEEVTFYVFCFMLGILFAQEYARFKRRRKLGCVVIDFEEKIDGKEEECSDGTDSDNSDSKTE